MFVSRSYIELSYGIPVSPFWEVLNNVLEGAYIPELATDKTAVKSTKLIIAAAPASPDILKT
ncbi:hypothetical protein ABE28_004695 [Peribacillus muralis]|uniref:Uncharacterized protein n=1 Tax=Peribacillus muralis TaxID=264697 RepID=A0A1B3XK99_9BACI|nr:hypothetical protein ABE28_004695 [Peribacillus muralis]